MQTSKPPYTTKQTEAAAIVSQPAADKLRDTLNQPTRQSKLQSRYVQAMNAENKLTQLINSVYDATPAQIDLTDELSVLRSIVLNRLQYLATLHELPDTEQTKFGKIAFAEDRLTEAIRNVERSITTIQKINALAGREIAAGVTDAMLDQLTKRIGFACGDFDTAERVNEAVRETLQAPVVNGPATVSANDVFREMLASVPIAPQTKSA